MLTVTIPGLRLVSEANAHEHWRKRSARARHQKSITARDLTTFARAANYGPPLHPVPLVVTITRVGTRLMDSDNAVGAAKHVRDAIAAWLGRDDSEKGLVDWRVVQRKGPYGVEIRIETADESWPKRGGHLTEIERAQLRKIGQSSKARGSRREEVV